MTIVPTPSFVKGITDGLAKYCGDGCKYNYINAPVPEWATKIQPSVQSALLADPTINYIIPIYDSACRSSSCRRCASPASTKSVKIATFNGTPFVIDVIRAATSRWTSARASAGSPARSLDGYMRHLCGLQTTRHALCAALHLRRGNAETAGVAGRVRHRAMATACRRLCQALDALNERLASSDGAGEAPALPSGISSKRFGGASSLNDVALDVAARRGPWPARPERLGQVDADQDPRRVPCARTRRGTA